jgi:hypothetical protein
MDAVPVSIIGAHRPTPVAGREDPGDWNPFDEAAFTTFSAPVVAQLVDSRMLVVYGCAFWVCVLLADNVEEILKKRKPDYSFLLNLDVVVDWTSDWNELGEHFVV